jgi:hypothetical protein
MKKPQGRHVLVVRQDVVHEQRNVVDTLCFDGATGTPDQRHCSSQCLPIRLQPGEKALVLGIQLLYCTNDTDREWRFQLQGELWDGQKEPIHVVVPPHAKGVVPSLDRLVYRNEMMAKCPEFVQYLGQEHAIMGAHSTCVGSGSSGVAAAAADFQLFKENDPFLQFLRRHWSTFPELNEFDIQLVPTTTTKDDGGAGDIYQVSQRAVDRATHFFKTVFGKIRYKTRDTPLTLLSPPPPPPTIQGDDSQETKRRKDAFYGVVVMLSLDYLAVAPAAPKCRVMDYPLNFI